MTGATIKTAPAKSDHSCSRAVLVCRCENTYPESYCGGVAACLSQGYRRIFLARIPSANNRATIAVNGKIDDVFA